MSRKLFTTCCCLLLGKSLSHGDADGGIASHWVRPAAPAGVKGHDKDYTVNGATYQGYVAEPAQKSKKLPRAVLIAHQYMGLGEYEKARAEEMAGMGYVAFALDVYGKGVRCTNATCATETMNAALSDTPKLRGLISAGTQQLLKYAQKDSRLVAVGYCFGGEIVLELARHPRKGASEGVFFDAVSSIHGLLGAFANETSHSGEIHSNIQIHHAEFDDQGDGALETTKAELKVATNGTVAQWEAIYYSKVYHGWTELGTPVYNARAAVQAHKSTFEFFQMAVGLEDPNKDPFPQSPFCQEQGSDATFHV